MNVSMELDTDDDENPPPFPLMLSTLVVLAVDKELEEEEANDSLAFINQVLLLSMATSRRLEERNKNKRRSTSSKKCNYINYNRERARQAVQDDYLGPHPIFRDYQFERFFQITRSHFDLLLTTCCKNDPFLWIPTTQLRREVFVQTLK